MLKRKTHNRLHIKAGKLFMEFHCSTKKSEMNKSAKMYVDIYTLQPCNDSSPALSITSASVATTWQKAINKTKTFQ